VNAAQRVGQIRDAHELLRPLAEFANCALGIVDSARQCARDLGIGLMQILPQELKPGRSNGGSGRPIGPLGQGVRVQPPCGAGWYTPILCPDLIVSKK
jgi:hypothetical protein